MPAARACGSQAGSSGSSAAGPCSPCRCAPGPSAHADADDAGGACEGGEGAQPSGSGTCSSRTHAHTPASQAGDGLVSRRVKEEAGDGGGGGGGAHSQALAAMDATHQQPSGGAVVKVLRLSVGCSPVAQLAPSSHHASCSLVPGEPRASQRMPLAAAPAASSHRGTQQQPSPRRTSGGDKENCGTHAACMPRLPAAGSPQPRGFPGGARPYSPPGREQGCSTHAKSASGCMQHLSGCCSIAAPSTAAPTPTCSWHAPAVSSPSAPAAAAEQQQQASQPAHGSRDELAGEQLAVSQAAAAAAAGGVGPSGSLTAASQQPAPQWLQEAQERLDALKAAQAATSARSRAKLTLMLAEQAAFFERMRALRPAPRAAAAQGHAPTTS